MFQLLQLVQFKGVNFANLRVFFQQMQNSCVPERSSYKTGYENMDLK